MRNPKFKAQLAEMDGLHDTKNTDYANDGNPYSNFEEAAAVAEGFTGVDAVFAALIGVKLARLRELTSSGKTPNNESITDTRTDLAMYATLWASYHRPTAERRKIWEIGKALGEEALRAQDAAAFSTGDPGDERPGTYDDHRNEASPCAFCQKRILTNPKACAGGCLFERWPTREDAESDATGWKGM